LNKNQKVGVFLRTASGGVTKRPIKKKKIGVGNTRAFRRKTTLERSKQKKGKRQRFAEGKEGRFCGRKKRKKAWKNDGQEKGRKPDLNGQKEFILERKKAQSRWRKVQG